MVSSINTVCLIVFAVLIVNSCTAFPTADSDEQESDSAEQLYSFREVINMLMNRRGVAAAAAKAGSAIINAADVCLSAITELGPTGRVVTLISRIDGGAAEEKAAFCRLYQKLYASGKLDHALLAELRKSAQDKNSMTAAQKAKCIATGGKDVAVGLRGDAVNVCLFVAKEAIGRK